MKLPRDISGRELAKLLKKYDFSVTRQSGSHIRLTSSYMGNTHHITIPDHDPLKLGTSNSILNDLANYLVLTKEELIDDLLK